MDLNYFSGVLTDEERDVLEEALNLYWEECDSDYRKDHNTYGVTREMKQLVDNRLVRRQAIAADLIKRCQP